MNRLSESREILIPPNPAVDALAAQQDFYRRVVADYRARQRRRKLFREIGWAFYWAVIASAALVWILRMVGVL